MSGYACILDVKIWGKTYHRKALLVDIVNYLQIHNAKSTEKDETKSLHLIMTHARPQLQKSVNSSESAYLFSVALNLISTEPW